MHEISKRSHMETEDLISQLPDHLLHKILLELLTKDSVKTSVLSRRWRYVWQCVPGLDLNFINFRYRFVTVCFVDKFLDWDKKSSRINQFKLDLDCCGNEIQSSHLNKWIDSVVARGVQQVVVKAPNFTIGICLPLKLPISICKCQTLVHLNLFKIVMPSCDIFSLPRLETLHLSHVRFPSETALERLISSSQVLRVLNISMIGFKVFRVLSRTLNSLRILSGSYYSSKNIGVVIDAPVLKSLSLIDTGAVDERLNNLFILSKLINDSSETEAMSNFLAVISKVTNLVLSWRILKTIYAYLELQPLPQLGTLTHLQVIIECSAMIYDSDLNLLLTFLASCPNLKSLDLRTRGYLAKLNTSSSLVPKCLLTSLERVYITSSDLYYLKAKTRLVEYILGNATLLRTFTIDLDRASEKEKDEVAKQVLMFPRCSLACQVFVR